METKAALKVVRARVKCVLIYSNIEKATFWLLLGYKLQTLFQNGQSFVATYQQQLSRLPTTVSIIVAPSQTMLGGRNSSLVVLGLAVHSVAGSILLWGNFPVERIFPLEFTWVQTPFPQKLFRMRV